ncbi:hypothetical protein MTP99_014066 [Tenebrio molitor]|nr:hypothetical protein MTP99_014066 [Tenebrio molitor]CAH1365471.1 unnamed protein product [Tenebrio molitor]
MELNNIKLSFVSFAFWSICLAQCKRQKVRPAETEDSVVLRQSVEQFGPPRPLNYANYTLPGPEITTNLVESGNTDKLDDFVTENAVDDQFGNYTFKVRRIKEYFSYNDRYETGEKRMIDSKKMFVVMGQFSEIFERKSGGHYIRTLGYINDEHGYRLFLIDLSKIITKRKKVTTPTNAQPDIQSRFFPAQLRTLSGGGLG